MSSKQIYKMDQTVLNMYVIQIYRYILCSCIMLHMHIFMTYICSYLHAADECTLHATRFYQKNLQMVSAFEFVVYTFYDVVFVRSCQLWHGHPIEFGDLCTELHLLMSAPAWQRDVWHFGGSRKKKRMQQSRYRQGISAFFCTCCKCQEHLNPKSKCLWKGIEARSGVVGLLAFITFTGSTEKKLPSKTDGYWR